MPDFQCHLSSIALKFITLRITHSFFKRSGLDNLQLTIVVGQCELSDMLSFRWNAEERKEFSGLSVKVVKGHTVVSRAESNNEI